MAKYNIYAVAYGINPIVNTTQPMIVNLKFKTWEECRPFVSGVKGARYKGFLTESEADAWLEKTIKELTQEENDVESSNPVDNSSWQDKTAKVYTSKIHPVDQEFIVTCSNLGLSVHDTEHMVKKMFIDIVKYLKDNDCISELPFIE